MPNSQTNVVKLVGNQHRSAAQQAAPKTRTMRRGRIEFFDDVATKKRCPACTVAVTYYQRPWENGHELGGWWVIFVNDDCAVDVAGPFATLTGADRIWRRVAKRYDCNFIPPTAEEIDAAIAAMAQLRADQNRTDDGSDVSAEGAPQHRAGVVPSNIKGGKP